MKKEKEFQSLVKEFLGLILIVAGLLLLNFGGGPAKLAGFAIVLLAMLYPAFGMAGDYLRHPRN